MNTPNVEDMKNLLEMLKEGLAIKKEIESKRVNNEEITPEDLIRMLEFAIKQKEGIIMMDSMEKAMNEEIG